MKKFFRWDLRYFNIYSKKKVADDNWDYEKLRRWKEVCEQQQQQSEKRFQIASFISFFNFYFLQTASTTTAGTSYRPHTHQSVQCCFSLDFQHQQRYI